MIGAVSATSDTNDIPLGSDTTGTTISHTDTHTNDKTSSNNNDKIINKKDTEKTQPKNNTKDNNSLKKTKKDTVTTNGETNTLNDEDEDNEHNAEDYQRLNNEITSLQKKEEISTRLSEDISPITSNNSDDIIASDTTNDDAIGSNNENNILTTSSFEMLQEYIDDTSEGSEIRLDTDYSLADGGDTIKISKNIIINGYNHTLDGNNQKTIFSINADGKSVTLKNIIFTKGKSSDNGSAILNTHSSTSLTLINCQFKDNYADDYGGAIYTDGNISIVDSKFYSNQAKIDGGAIYCKGTSTVKSSEFRDNSAKGAITYKCFGGAIKSEGECDIDSCIFNGNHADNYGGAIYADDDLTITSIHNINDMGFMSNTAKDYGGAIYACKNLYINWNLDSYPLKIENNEIKNDDGGAIYCCGNTFINNTIISSNKAYTDGGAIYCKGETYIHNSEFSKNKETSDHSVNKPNKGGAIYSYGKCYINSCTFDNNGDARRQGGAIYAQDDLTITGQTKFTNNNGAYASYESSKGGGGAIYACKNLYINWNMDGTCELNSNSATYALGGAICCEKNIYAKFLKIDNNKAQEGAAIYCFRETHLNNSEISENKVSTPITHLWSLDSQNGGAIFSGGKCYIDSCTFKGNNVFMHGGAIYANDDLTITGQNSFDNNEAYAVIEWIFDYDGGAIYCCGNLFINNTNFKGNGAGTDGGAIYCKGKCTISNSNFKKNILRDIASIENRYGAAIRSEGLTTVTNCNFDNNYAQSESVTHSWGGAIYTDGEIIIKDCSFVNNKAYTDGGAIYCSDKATISDSKFENNAAIGGTLERSFGGAIRSKGLTTVTNCNFTNNNAHNQGGAIYADTEIIITDSTFTSNSAKLAGAVYAETISQTVSKSTFKNNKATDGEGGAIYINDKCSPEFIYCIFEENTCTDDGGAIYLDSSSTPLKVSYCNFEDNKADVDGGAIFCKSETTILESKFQNNVATKKTTAESYGGAVRSKGLATLTNTNFYNNYAYNWGGAIYADEEIIITKCEFINNSANYGGAIYASTINQVVSNSIFNKNKANNDGGAIYIYNKCNPEFTSCSFEENECNDRGGAIYLDSSSAPLALSYCTFINNKATDGGAVYTGIITKTVSNSVFLKNKAISNDGGAIYINNECSPEFISCRFEENECNDRGGAIYLDSMNSHLKLSYSTFVDNKAGQSGQIVYNKGYYDLVDMCWFGTNNPSFNDQFKIWHLLGANDYDVTNYLKIALKLNDTNIYIGNTYKATVYFSDVNGNYLNNDLSHSTGSFYGDGQFSNAKTDCNDMTADVIFTKENPTINGKIDHQIVSLSPNVKDKETSEVRIISCENVTYPNALKVDYQITNMSNKATYIIKNNAGTIIKEGEITKPQSTLTINNLNIGDYSITINNPETWTTLASSATAKFKVTRTVSATLTVNNVTYGNPTTITLKTDYDDTYKVTINKITIEMNVVNGICQKQINLNAGQYITHTKPNNDYIILNCKEAAFRVNKASNRAIITVENETYGTPSTMQIHADADGTYNVDINGTTYNVTVNNGVGQKTINLNAGQYYANITFNNKNYKTTTHNTKFNIYKANIDLIVIVFDEYYGDEVECIVYASRDGEYNLTVGGFSTTITVKDNFGYQECRILDTGKYTATVSFAGDINYNPAINTRNFTVYPANTSFELKINASTIIYGETATISPQLSKGATGKITYYLSNGTLLGTLNVNENLTLPILDVGTYVIIGKYSGDHDFNPANDSAFLTVNQATNNVVVRVYNVTYGEATLINVSADIDGTYQLDLNGTIYNITTENGKGNKEINLPAGKYYANITFNNKNYKTNADNAIFSVYKADTHITHDVSYIVYPEELKGIIYSDVDGKYNLTLGDYSTIILVEHGEGMFNFGTLDAGPYIIIANYSGDMNHNPAHITLPVTVHPAPNNAVVSVANVTYGEDALIVVSAEIDGIYQIDVNGTIHNLTVVNNTGNISISLNTGTYYANLTFDNKNYNTTAHNTTFSIYKADTHIFIAAFDTTYPQELKGIIYSDVDGEYNLTIGNYSNTIHIKYGRAEYNAGSFNAGKYLVVVNYTGDPNHNPKSSSKEATVNKFKPEITLNAYDIDYGGVETISINCDIPGSVNITVNGITETLNLDNVLNGYGASLSLYNLNSGSYPVSIVYNGNNNIESFKVTSNFKVNALNVNMEIYTQDITVGDDEIITVNLPSIVTGDVTITIDGKSYTTPVKDGKATITIPNLSAGNKNVNVYYSGDLNHNPTIRTVSFNVNKITTKITTTPITTTYNINKNLIITLKDNNGNTLTGLKVYVDLNGIKEYTTDENGQIKIPTKELTPKKYTAKIRFPGNNKYEETKTNIEITIQKATPKITAKNKTFKITTKKKKYTITLKDNTGKPIKKAKITLKIGKKTYKATTNKKGKVTFKITNINKKIKTYKATITYKGNKYYKKTNKKIKIKTIFKTINKNSKDKNSIKKIQKALKHKGYYLRYDNHYLMIDGIYKKCTHRSVKQFQKNNKLKTTGNVNEKTAKKLGIIK